MATSDIVSMVVLAAVAIVTVWIAVNELRPLRQEGGESDQG